LSDRLDRIGRFYRLLNNLLQATAGVCHVLKRGFISAPVFLLLGSETKTLLEILQTAGRSTFAPNVLPVDCTLRTALLTRNGWRAGGRGYRLGE